MIHFRRDGGGGGGGGGGDGIKVMPLLFTGSGRRVHVW